MQRGALLRSIVATAILLLSAIALPTFVPANDKAASLQPLVDAATKEGQLVWYTPSTKGDVDAIIAAFRKKYPGIKVDYLRLASGQLSQRFAAERSSGAPTSDIYTVTDPVFQLDALKKGWIVPLQDAKLPNYPGDFPAKYIDSSAGTVIFGMTASVIAYNTDLVRGTDIPQTWEDVLNPKWKGKILVPDPRSTASYIGTWSALLTKLPPDYIERLLALKPRFVEGGAVPATQLLAAGEGAFVIPGLGSASRDAARSGAPIKFLLPDMSAGPQAIIGINSQARNPNAARLFATFLISPEARSVVADSSQASISPYDEAAAMKVLPILPEYFEAQNASRILRRFGLK